jgi:hypothetical protein
MGFLDNLFGKKNNLEGKINNINLLRTTMRQNEAIIESKNLIRELMQTPSLINGINNYADLGNFLTNQFNLFQSNQELEFIAEISFYASTKSLINQIDPNVLYDRLLVLYNAEDFITDTIINANNFQHNPLSRFSSSQNIRWMADDILLKMRYHDLFQENKFYRNGSNDNTFNGQEFIDLSNRIQQGSFESNNPQDIVSKGKESIDKCFNFISRKYSLTN